MADGPLLYNAAALAAVIGSNGPQVLFKYSPQGNLSSTPGFGGTFSRADASTCATYVDANGVVQTVAANIIRDAHFISGTRTTLLEGSRTNGVLRSQNFENAAWTQTAVTSVLLNATGPDGLANTANTLVASGSTVQLAQITAQALGAGAKGTVSLFVKAGSGANFVVFGDQGDAANHRTWVNVSTGACSSTDGGGTTTTTSLGNGWFRVSLTYTTTNAYNQRFNIFLSRTTGAGDAVSGDSALIYGAMVEVNTAFPSSYIATGASAVTRASDSLSFPFSPVPQAMTVYGKWVSQGWGLDAVNTQSVVNVGKITDATALRAILSNGTGTMRGEIRMASTTAAANLACANAYGDTIEGRYTQNSAASATINRTINAGSETSSAAFGVTPFDAAYTTPTLYVGYDPTGANHEIFGAVQKIVVLAGVQSLATCQAA